MTVFTKSGLISTIVAVMVELLATLQSGIRPNRKWWWGTRVWVSRAWSCVGRTRDATNKKDKGITRERLTGENVRITITREHTNERLRKWAEGGGQREKKLAPPSKEELSNMAVNTNRGGNRREDRRYVKTWSVAVWRARACVCVRAAVPYGAAVYATRRR